MAEGRLWALAAVTMALLAYRNSWRDGVRVRERSSAKSSAAKIRPWSSLGVAVQMEFRFERACADSIRARILRGEEWSLRPRRLVWYRYRSGRMRWITSETKCRSEAEWHFGRTMVSTFGALSFPWGQLAVFNYLGVI